jgi:hypothetical protein
MGINSWVCFPLSPWHLARLTCLCWIRDVVGYSLLYIYIYIHAWMYSGARHSPVKCEIELFISKKFVLWLKWICEGMMSLKELSVFSSFSHIKSRFGPSASVANEKIVMICFSWVVHRCVAIPWSFVQYVYRYFSCPL